MFKRILVFGSIAIALVLLLPLAVHLSSNNSAPAGTVSSHAKPFTPDENLFIHATAGRTDDGRVVISGDTNLPEGLKLWVEVEDGKLPRGGPKVIASDDSVFVGNGRFTSQPLWMPIPNTAFTKKGWPQGVVVDVRERPFPSAPFSVHFTSIFNSAWQSAAVLKSVGGEGGKGLKGQIIRPENPDVVDSSKTVDYVSKITFPPLSSEAKAISLVRAAILSTPEGGRSTGDVQAVVDLYTTSPGVKVGKGWAAKDDGPNRFTVSFDFIDGSLGEQQALWQADLTSGRVKYVNENAKRFSWAPNY